MYYFLSYDEINIENVFYICIYNILKVEVDGLYECK